MQGLGESFHPAGCSGEAQNAIPSFGPEHGGAAEEGCPQGFEGVAFARFVFRDGFAGRPQSDGILEMLDEVVDEAEKFQNAFGGGECVHAKAFQAAPSLEFFDSIFEFTALVVFPVGGYGWHFRRRERCHDGLESVALPIE